MAGRKPSFGSDSEEGAAFTAVLYSVIGTLATNGTHVRRWLHEGLAACARNETAASRRTTPTRGGQGR